MLPLLTGTSHLMGRSSIRALRTLRESFTVYAVLIGDPETGKSPAMRIIKDALIQIENHQNVEKNNSLFVSSGTVEATVHYLKELGNYTLLLLLIYY